jgi:hypothetical protein
MFSSGEIGIEMMAIAIAVIQTLPSESAPVVSPLAHGEIAAWSPQRSNGTMVA